MGLKTTGNIQGRMNTRILTAAETLTVEMSGTCFFLDAAGQALTLPDAATAKGVYYWFIVNAPLSGSWVLTSAGTNDLHYQGTSGADGAAAASSVETSVDLFTFITGQGNPGDDAMVISDGTKWHVMGRASVVAGQTEG